MCDGQAQLHRWLVLLEAFLMLIIFRELSISQTDVFYGLTVFRHRFFFDLLANFTKVLLRLLSPKTFFLSFLLAPCWCLSVLGDGQEQLLKRAGSSLAARHGKRHRACGQLLRPRDRSLQRHVVSVSSQNCRGGSLLARSVHALFVVLLCFGVICSASPLFRGMCM